MHMPEYTSIDSAFFQDLANLQVKSDLSELAYLFDATLLAFPPTSAAQMSPLANMERTVSLADLHPQFTTYQPELSLVDTCHPPGSPQALHAVLHPDLHQTISYSNRRRPSCVAILRLRRNAVFVPRIVSDAISEEATSITALGRAADIHSRTAPTPTAKRKSDALEHNSVATDRKSTKGYSARVNNILEDWAANNRTNPYPSLQDKLKLMRETGLTKMQLKNWFCNVRRRKLPGTIRRPKKDTRAHRR
ncbi:Homeobox protein tos8 [Coemansia spiralis]|uniref:Homeobox protein tos8 n=1 Tax=Coemansia spiralis TaxID=417178 RepID=A0A9W8GP18_9FUNG|nr:Homeobox protein tos8 [Coemansia spiralis]